MLLSPSVLLYYPHDISTGLWKSSYGDNSNLHIQSDPSSNLERVILVLSSPELFLILKSNTILQKCYLFIT